MKYIFVYSFLIFLLAFSCKSNQEQVKDDVVQEFQEIGYPEIDQLTAEIMKEAKDPELYFQRAQAYYNIEAYDNAITDMYVAMKIDSMQPAYYYFLSEVFLNYYRSSQALGTLKKAHALFPENEGASLRYAELLITLKQNQEAVRVIDDVMRVNDQNPDAFFLMGLIMKEENDERRAKASFKRTVELDPEFTDAYILLGELYENDNPKLALQYLDNAVQVNPKGINALHSKAYFLQNNDKVEDALEIYKEINLIDPRYVPAFLNSGILHIEQDSLDLAIEKFNIITQIEPENHVAYFFRGLSYQYKGNKDQAKADFQQSLNLEPDYEKASRALKLLESE